MTACMPVIMRRLLDPTYSRDDLGIWGDVNVLQAKQILSGNLGDRCNSVDPMPAISCSRGFRLRRAPNVFSYIIYETTRKMRPEPSLTLTKRIVATLTERIVNGSLPPGAPVRQDQVAEEFGSSHVPFEKLFVSWRGLLVALQRKGVRVAPLDPESVVEISLMRATLEGLALQQAMSRLTQLDLALAKKAMARGVKSRSVSIWEMATREFHMALVQACGILVAAIAKLHRKSVRYLFATWKHLNWRSRSDAEHVALLECVEARDAAGADAILRRHIIDAGSALATQLGQPKD
jgi:DNA-binding GntR family transcriptional regulator